MPIKHKPNQLICHLGLRLTPLPTPGPRHPRWMLGWEDGAPQWWEGGEVMGEAGSQLPVCHHSACIGPTTSQGPPGLPLSRQCAHECQEAQLCLFGLPGSLEEQSQCWGLRPLAELAWCLGTHRVVAEHLQPLLQVPPAPSGRTKGSPGDLVLPTSFSSRPTQASRRTWSRRSSTTALRLPSLTSL